MTTSSLLSFFLKSILHLSGLKQLITESTRITKDTLIDVILTNDPSHVAMSTSIPCDISDHNIIGYVRKINFKRFLPKVIIFETIKITILMILEMTLKLLIGKTSFVQTM